MAARAGCHWAARSPWSFAQNAIDSGYTSLTNSGSGTKTYSLSEESSAITGSGTRTESGTDNYSLGGTYAAETSTVQGSESYTQTTTSNDQNGGFERTITGGGSYTGMYCGTDTYALEGSTSYTHAASGNYVDGYLSLSQSGTDRYDLLPRFLNTANDQAAGAPLGTMDFSPVGAPLFVGQGVKPPTGGGSFSDGRAATDAFFAELGGAAGSLAASGVRGMEGMGLFEGTAGYEASGAAADAAFAELGSSYAYEYCFPAGTMVPLRGGALKTVEGMALGDRVECHDERDPEGPITEGEVVRVFHNAPAELCRIHFAGQSLRATLNHPFYVRGKGFVPAIHLQPGDELRTNSGEWLPVDHVDRTGEVEAVYNFEVATKHTYFVAAAPGVPAVLVHNISFWDMLSMEKNGVNEFLRGVEDKVVDWLNSGKSPSREFSRKLRLAERASVLPTMGDLQLDFREEYIKEWDKDEHEKITSELRVSIKGLRQLGEEERCAVWREFNADKGTAILPYVNDYRDWREVIEGKDLITRQPMDSQERLNTLRAAVLPYVSAREVRMVDELRSGAAHDANRIRRLESAGEAEARETRRFDLEVRTTDSSVSHLTEVTTPWQRRVYQRADIDWDFVRPEGVELSGQTNRAAARQGYAPVRINPATGKADDIVLHHLLDDPRGAVVETWRSSHTRFHNTMEREPNRWRQVNPDWARAWNNEQSAYWRWRTGAYNPPRQGRLRLPGDE